MKLEGDLQEIDLVPHLLALAAERFTGAIRFENDGIIKILYFKEGDVLSASTNDRADSVDEILLRAGKVNRDHIRQALGKRKDNETLGDALLSLGFISRKELAWGRRTQIVGILRSVAGWPAGSYQIVHDYLPNREEGTLFYLPQIILELAVTDPDKAAVEKRIEGGVSVYRKLPVFGERYARLALNEDADAIVEQIDGEKTAAEIAAVSKLDVFAVYKLLLALEALGMIERDKPQAIHEVYLPQEDALPPSGSGEPSVVASGGLVSIPEPPGGALLEDGGPEEAHPDPSWSAPDLAGVPIEPEPEAPFDEPVQASGRPPIAARRRRSPLLLLLVLVVLLAAAGWWAWSWWSGRAAGAASAPMAKPVTTTTPTAQGAPPVEPAVIDAAPTATIPAVPDATTSAERPATETAAAAPGAAPVPAAAADPERARYQRMGEEFARERASVAYAVQFELACQTESVKRALEAGAMVWFVPVQYRGASCFRVFWGTYATREDAEKAKGEIPAELRGSGPVVVRPRELLQ